MRNYSIYKTSITLMALLVSFSSFSQKKDDSKKDAKKEKTYSDIITDKAVTDNGLFDVHKIDDKYYLSLIHISEPTRPY